MEDHDLLTMTADIVSAYVGHNNARASELPGMIAAVHASLVGIVAPQPAEEVAPPLTPAVPIRKSIAEDYLICLDDGKKFKSLKRHLSQLGMTPDEYRAKWGLPREYPMVAPGYAAKRSELAKLSGLGNSRRMMGRDGPTDEQALEATAPEDAIPEEANAEAPPELAAKAEVGLEVVAPRKRGRPKKALAGV